MPEIVCVSADFLAAFPLKVLVDLSSFYFGFDFFSDIKGIQYRAGIKKTKDPSLQVSLPKKVLIVHEKTQIFIFTGFAKRYEKLLLVFHETAIITRVKVSEAIFYNLIP